MFPYVIQTKKFINFWIIFGLLIIFSLLFILLKKYENISTYTGIKENNQTQILIEENNIPKLPDKLIFENKKYNYQIKEISDNYYINNNKIYKMITIESDYKTNKKAVELKFVYGKKSLFDNIKGGNIWKK